MFRRLGLFCSFSFLAVVTVPATIARAEDRERSEFERSTNKQLLDEAFVNCVRKVRFTLVQAATESKLTGDARTEHLVRAASIGCELPEEHRARAILLGLAISFDPDLQMRQSVVTKRFWEKYETAAEQKARLAVLGNCTIDGRSDLVFHFFIAAGLTALTSPNAAEAMSILKEVSDSNGGTGFSFVDLGADLAGIVFAERMITDSKCIRPFIKDFRVDTHVPSFLDLPEGIMIGELRKDFSFDSRNRFKQEVNKLRVRVLELPVYKSDQEALSAERP